MDDVVRMDQISVNVAKNGAARPESEEKASGTGEWLNVTLKLRGDATQQFGKKFSFAAGPPENGGGPWALKIAFGHHGGR